MEHELRRTAPGASHRVRGGRAAAAIVSAGAIKLAVLVLTFIITGVAMWIGAGTAQAGLDNEKSATDRYGHHLTVQQWDTIFHPAPPMDSNRLTREWFYSGRAAFEVTGNGSDEFTGTLEFGYQVGIPWTVGVGVNFTYTTPNALGWDAPVWDLAYAPVTPYLLPGATLSTDVGNGPGVQELVTFSVPVSGAGGTVAIANGHGTVTGVAGAVQVRAFARLTWPDHASITTYGSLWNVD